MNQSVSEFLNLLQVRAATWNHHDLSGRDEMMVEPQDCVFVYFVVEGSVCLSSSSADGVVDLSADTGEALLVPSGAGHAIRAAKDLLGASPIPDTSSAMKGKCIGGAVEVRWPGGFDPLSLPAIAKVPEETNPLHANRLRAASDIGTLGPMLNRAASFMLVCLIRENPKCASLLRDANFRDPIARAVQFLEIHPFRPWTVDGLAKKVGLGRSTFASRFHCETGKPPMEVLADIRMDLAMKLLKETELKISDVAERVGYNSSSAFIRRFTSHFEIAPGKVRTSTTAS